MTTMTHTAFREAIMRAYVRGWIDGRDGKLTDEGKHETADATCEAFPAENNAPQLLAACREVENISGEMTATGREATLGLRLYESVHDAIKSATLAD